VLSAYTGRGPTKARTYLTGDLITVVLQDALTKGERSLVRYGQGELVLKGRKAYQKTMSAELIAAVEQISGRRVIAFLSDNHIDPDYAIESFVLAPSSEEHPGDVAQTAASGEGAEEHPVGGEGSAPVAEG
jgi:uncharacterized protein YbcI